MIMVSTDQQGANRPVGTDEKNRTQVDVAEVVPVPRWQARAWEWLDVAGRRAGLPGLVIGLAALALSVA